MSTSCVTQPPHGHPWKEAERARSLKVEKILMENAEKMEKQRKGMMEENEKMLKDHRNRMEQGKLKLI